ncbi:MAG: hypothetical protein ACRD8O_19645 [Bryobacteraceae bacterium]
MPRALLLLAVAASLHAGAVRGVVLEQASGRPLARTVVILDPIPQPGLGKPRQLTTRASRGGSYVFPSVEPGLYVLQATHPGYFPAAYGQRAPAGRGAPIEVTKESELFAELRLRHKGAITGRVLNENGVGRAGVNVVAYRARMPLRSAGTAVSDDRGIYRVHGLDPGKYWIRSDSHTLDDGSGWLPIFGFQARETRDALVHRVTVDTDTPNADVTPEPGNLFRLGGVISCDIGGPVIVTLSSETGRRRAKSSCPVGSYRFDGLAPGPYEVLAALEDGAGAGFLETVVARDNNAGGVRITTLPAVSFEVRREGSTSVTDIPLTVSARRRDLAEFEADQEITRPSANLAPGYWEMRATPPRGHYVESIVNMRGTVRRPVRTDPEQASDWFQVLVETPPPGTRIRITLSDKAAQIAGRVVSDGKPMPGVPVFLWPVAESARRSLGGPPQSLSDIEGRFRFESLPPGDYRPLASFDVNEIDPETIDAARASIIRAEPSQTKTIELPVWLAPW